MKKKKITLIAALLCMFGAAFALSSGEAFADVVCQMSNTSLEQCNLKLKQLNNYGTLKNKCNQSSAYESCINDIKSHLSCDGYNSTAEWCENKKTEYAKGVYTWVIGAGSKSTKRASCAMYRQSEEECYTTLKDKDGSFESIKATCKTGGLTACEGAVDDRLDCINIGTGSICDAKKTSYTKKLYDCFVGDTDKCPAAADDTDDPDGDGSGTTGDDDTDVEGEKALSTVTEGDCATILSAWCHKDSDQGIRDIIHFIINILTGAIVVAGTVGIIFCGYTWMSARDDEQKVATAKKRIYDIVIGIVAWILIYALANLFIPKSESELEQGNFDSIVTEIKK